MPVVVELGQGRGRCCMAIGAVDGDFEQKKDFNGARHTLATINDNRRA